MADFPILFTGFRHVVKGPSYEAVITASGRTLISEENGEWWCSGVEPGGIIVEGEGPHGAYEKFRAAFRHALEDIAEQAKSFKDFEGEVCALFHTDDADAQRWEAALKRIQTERDVPEPLAKLPRKIWNESEIEIQVLPLEKLEHQPMDAGVREEPALPQAA